MKHFYSAFNFRKVFTQFTVPSQPYYVSRANAVKGLQLLGYRAVDDLVGNSMDIPDLFNFEQAVKELVY